MWSFRDRPVEIDSAAIVATKALTMGVNGADGMKEIYSAFVKDS
jgi:hypothetical protein